MSGAPRSSGFPALVKYELKEEIGHGGMATVYRARDPRLQRDVAVKIIHKHLRDNAEVNRRFTSEARAVAKLRHPNIVEVYDVSDDDDEERFLVVELIRGSSLREVLTANGVLPAEVAGILVMALCDAAQHAHDSEVIHRDIKPENVLIEGYGAEGNSVAVPRRVRPILGSNSGRGIERVKLTDFGIAKLLDGQGLTSTGQILGSPAHMAPEQIEGGHIGPQTDVFALGVLMYECMVGSLPFEGKNPAQVLRRVLEGDFEPADSQRPRVGRRWANIVAVALDKDYQNRFQTALEFGECIREELVLLDIHDYANQFDRYFSEPDSYCVANDEQLLSRLLARGAQGQKTGDVQGAAADFNRALAFRPNDIEIIKRVAALTRGQATKRRAVRAALIVAGSVALGSAAFGVARVVRALEAVKPAVPFVGEFVAQGSLPVPSAGKSAAPVAPQPVAATSASARVASVVVSPPALPSTPPAPATTRKRKVRFRVNPGGARLLLDGRVVDWSAAFELTPGPHRLRAEMPPGNLCCEPRARSIVVAAPPGDRPGEVQTFVVNLPFRVARARLLNAPAGASVSCANGLTVQAGGASQVRMNRVAWTGTCTQSPGGARTGITMRAGEMAAIVWR